EFKYILDHRKEYNTVMTQTKVERKIFRTAAYNLQPLADNNDTVHYFLQRTVVSDLHIRPVDSFLFNLDLMLYENNKRWSSYQTTALDHTQDYDWNDYSQLQHIAKQFLQNVS